MFIILFILTPPFLTLHCSYTFAQDITTPVVREDQVSCYEEKTLHQEQWAEESNLCKFENMLRLSQELKTDER